MPDFTISLDEEELQVWQKSADQTGCSLDHFISSVIPKMITRMLTLALVNPDTILQMEQAVLESLPEGVREGLLGFVERIADEGEANEGNPENPTR